MTRHTFARMGAGLAVSACSLLASLAGCRSAGDARISDDGPSSGAREIGIDRPSPTAAVENPADHRTREGGSSDAGSPGPQPSQVESSQRGPDPDPDAILALYAGDAQAPASYQVDFATSSGSFRIRVDRSLAPHGADRLYHLVEIGYFNGVPFYRVIQGVLVQFGLHADPRVNRSWQARRIPDDPARASNLRGAVSFAANGPGTRTTQLFINLRDNAEFDSHGAAPLGSVVSGMEVVESLYSGYGDAAPQGNGPRQEDIYRLGGATLDSFPHLDILERAELVAERRPETKL